MVDEIAAERARREAENELMEMFERYNEKVKELFEGNLPPEVVARNDAETAEIMEQFRRDLRKNLRKRLPGDDPPPES